MCVLLVPGHLTKTEIQKVEQVQRPAARFVAVNYLNTSGITATCVDLKWKLWNSVCTRRCLMYATMFFKIYKGLVRISLSYRMPALDATSRTNCKNVQCPV